MDVLQQVKKKQLSQVFLLYGSEAYFIQHLRKEITKLAVEDDEDVMVYDLEETSVQEVIADVETYPFFAERKLIVATNPVFLKTKSDKLSFEHDLDELDRYLKSPVDYTVLIIIAHYEKIDERKKISKQLKKLATVGVCNPIKDYELKSWVEMLADNLHITIEEAAFDVIEAELSTDLHLLENELTKLALYVGEGGVVTKAIAEDLIAHTVNSSALRLVDAVIERNLSKAIAIYKDLEKMKEEPIALIGLLAYQYRMILQVKLLKQKGYSQFQIQKHLGVHPYVVKIAMNREKQFTLEKLRQMIDKLAEADTSMKKSGMEKGLLFELLLYELVQVA